MPRVLAWLVAAASVVGASGPSPAGAASDGAASTTASTGTLRVSVQLPPLVRISRLQDISLAAGGGPELSGSSEACVYGSQGDYRLTALGSGSGGAFELQSGGRSLPYEVRWQPAGVGSAGEPLVAGESRLFSGAHTTSLSCSGAANATVRIVIGGASLATASPGDYTGTLTLILAPN